jgi:pyrroline-5-carboxylate reductase
MNPNAPSIVGAGFNPVVFAEGFPLVAREALLDLMAPLGASPQVSDSLIEACAVITAMGPTYFWFQFDALRQLAEAFGMEASFARGALRSMLHGAVDTLFDSDLPAQRVMDLVAVRPLADDEAQILGLLRERVAGIHLKLTS